MKKSTLGIIITLVSIVLMVVVVKATQPKPLKHNAGDTSERSISLDELSRHSSATDCWISISGNVYDVSSYISNHPGGTEILRGCGKDGTELFTKRRDGAEKVGSGSPHSGFAQATLDSFKIGTLEK